MSIQMPIAGGGSQPTGRPRQNPGWLQFRRSANLDAPWGLDGADMRGLHSIAIVALLLVGAMSPALATSSLSFVGDGYWIDMEIGHDVAPVISSIRFHRPGDPKGVRLVRRDVTVESFDTRRRILVMHFRGSQGSDAVDPFTLSVHGEQAILETSGRKIASRFNWEM